MITNKIQLIDGYWVIGTNNWSTNLYTKEQAEECSGTLNNCTNCINCNDCSDCRDCSYCSYCSYCWDCNNCRDCTYCEYSSNCSNCSNCHYCNDCLYCSVCNECRYCYQCHHCTMCSSCNNCSKCNYCNYCNNCNDCVHCNECNNFKSNPERITSPIIGSRKSHTTYYFTDSHEQIVCGCYKGTLSEFTNRVKETHGDNKHAQDYLKWVDKVKLYIQ